MPRSKPFTSHDIEGRKKFGLGPREARAAQAPAEPIPYEGPCWDFSLALGELGITGKAACARSAGKLRRICLTYFLTVEVERQETPARKAEALKKGRHDYASRQRAWERLAKANVLWATGKHETARRTEAEARCVLSRPWLPVALEMEASQRHVQLCMEAERLWQPEATWLGGIKILSQESVGMGEAVAVLEKETRDRSGPGRHGSEALRCKSMHLT